MLEQRISCGVLTCFCIGDWRLLKIHNNTYQWKAHQGGNWRSKMTRKSSWRRVIPIPPHTWHCMKIDDFPDRLQSILQICGVAKNKDGTQEIGGNGGTPTGRKRMCPGCSGSEASSCITKQEFVITPSIRISTMIFFPHGVTGNHNLFLWPVAPAHVQLNQQLSTANYCYVAYFVFQKDLIVTPAASHMF